MFLWVSWTKKWDIIRKPALVVLPAGSKGSIQTFRKIHWVRSPTHFLLRLQRFQICRFLGGMKMRIWHLSRKFTNLQGGSGGDPKLHTHLLRKDLCTRLDVTFQPPVSGSYQCPEQVFGLSVSYRHSFWAAGFMHLRLWLVISKNEITCQGHLPYIFTTTAELF